MTGVAWSGAAAPVLWAALFCAALVAWVLTGRNGPGQARILLAAGEETDTRPFRPGPQRRPWAGLGTLGTVRLAEGIGRRLGHRCGRVFGRRPGTRRLVRLGAGAGRAWWCLPAGGAVGLLGDSLLPLVFGAAAVPVAGRWESARRARVSAEKRESAVIELCTGVAGELRCGRMPADALLSAGGDRLGPEGAALLAAARFGGDVPAALHRAARLPGADGLRGAAACWQVATDGGAGLADGLDRVADALRAERDQRFELRAQLAGPRSTALVLALLPVFGLMLGTAMGAEPLRVLLHSPVGLACLVAGALFEGAGLAWVARLVRAAEEGR